jgi:hypothetical protein
MTGRGLRRDVKRLQEVKEKENILPEGDKDFQVYIICV